MVSPSVAAAKPVLVPLLRDQPSGEASEILVTGMDLLLGYDRVKPFGIRLEFRQGHGAAVLKMEHDIFRHHHDVAGLLLAVEGDLGAFAIGDRWHRTIPCADRKGADV